MINRLHTLYIFTLLLLGAATPAFAQTIYGNIYGGGNLSQVEGSTTINIKNGGITAEKEGDGNIYGGGYGASAVLTGNTTINVTGGSVSKDVYGGGALANVTGSTTININGGTVTQDVYGGGALANVSGNTSVNLNDGSIRNSYGGGLGSNEVAALVNGDATVTLGKLQEKADPSDPDVYTASKVIGSIFGANNVNGTPLGHVKVHILKTTPREGQTAGQYDVAAVYGGGNQAAYIPTNNEEKAEVLIENCDNSIAYVYGGGNAAPVPATDVKIYGANAIDNAFAGGNGAGDGNPGADIGYLNYYSTPEPAATTYGTGTASITVYGGTVNNVFGGSNTLGYIASSTSVNVTQPGNDDPHDKGCALNVGKVFGGGNEADINCNVVMNCDCNKGVELLYAGANNADVNGDITLNIYSGIYGQVFCGNNSGGAIRGNLTLNVDETGCWPVMISELYGGGYGAPYSVYGHNDDKSCKESGEKLYNDPTVNLISFTRIGKVFGGGYGKEAKLYGTTNIIINPIKGRWANETVALEYVLNANDERVTLSAASTFPIGLSKNGEGNLVIPDAVGTIGYIFGGGNAGDVIGNTNVNIGTEATNKHISGSDQEAKDVTVSITGNVYGGGNVADVTGQTNVKIGKDK